MSLLQSCPDMAQRKSVGVDEIRQAMGVIKTRESLASNLSLLPADKVG